MACNPIDIPRCNVVCGGTFHPHPKTRITAGHCLAEGWQLDCEDDLAALDLLQIKHDTPISAGSLWACVQYEYEWLPQQVQDRYMPPVWDSNEASIFTQSITDNAWATAFTDSLESNRDDYDDFIDAICATDYVIWLCNTDNSHWTVLILQVGPGNADQEPDEDDLVNATILSWAAVYPRRSPGAITLVNSVVRRAKTFLRSGEIEWTDDHQPRNLWVPPMNPPEHLAAGVPTDNFSSGIRAFALVREILARITYAMSLQMDNAAFDAELWKPMSGYLNVDKVRRDMIGAASTRLIDALGGGTRLAALPVQAFKHDDEQIVANELMPPDTRRRDMFVPNGESYNSVEIMEEEELRSEGRPPVRKAPNKKPRTNKKAKEKKKSPPKKNAPAKKGSAKRKRDDAYGIASDSDDSEDSEGFIMINDGTISPLISGRQSEDPVEKNTTTAKQLRVVKLRQYRHIEVYALGIIAEYCKKLQDETRR
ncbi:hypothetical protein BJ170DRAFT_713304 [Xylariales sp. AK1849]|nr:hypothetical protein BJ170DRAFT_713304 [Xylariales sp. AK1849]